MNGRFKRWRVLALPPLGSSRVIEVRLGCDDAGTLRAGQWRQFGVGYDTGRACSQQLLPVSRTGDKTQLGWRCFGQRGDAVDDRRGITMEFAAQCGYQGSQ